MMLAGKQRHLVTGGAGFIGSHLVEFLLAHGAEVIVMDNLFTGRRSNVPDGVEFIRHDVCEPFHIDCEFIWHLACPASPVHYQKNPVRTLDTAYLGTRNALACARDVGARLLIASTSEVYGDPRESPQKEEYWGHVNPIGIRACYDEGKRAAEALAVSWSSQYNVETKIARIFNTFGPRMAAGDGRLIPNFIMAGLKKEPITVYGDGRQTRSFCYVSDLVSGLVSLMYCNKFYKPCPVNLGNPDERTIMDVAISVNIRFPDSNIVNMSLPQDDPRQRCPDIGRAIQYLGWKPQVPFEAGLSNTIEWFRDAYHNHHSA